MTWTDITTSDTTRRNTSRFILVSPVESSRISGGVDFLPTVRSVDAAGRGPAWIVTSIDPITLQSSGDSTL